MRGVFWRQYLDWAILNVPFYLHFVLLCFWTLFFFLVAAPLRRAIVSNLRVVLPRGSKMRNYARGLRTFYSFAWVIADAAAQKLTNAPFALEISGEEYLEQLARGGGAILLTAHMGNYDLGAALFAQKFHRRVRMVRAPEPQSETEQHVRKSLGQSGGGAVEVAYNSAGALLSFDLLGALRAGEIVSIQGDRPIGGVAQRQMKLCGAPLQIPMGPFTLALAAEVPIHPLFILRTGYRRYRIVAHEPMMIRRTSPIRDDDIAPAMVAWTQTLESVVTQHWDQWFAFSPLFASDGI